MKQIDLLIGPIKKLITPIGARALRGKRQGSLKEIKQASIASTNGIIVEVGAYKTLKKKYRAKKYLSFDNELMLPGFIDSHTHALFAKSRAWEYGLRLKGQSYLDIAKKGGGILNSAKDLRKSSDASLRQNLKKVLRRMRRQGTTTVEVKSGYGLTLQSEIKMLEIIKSVNKRVPQRLVPTFLGAHEVPRQYRGRKSEFVNLVIDKWLPTVANKNLAEFCDVFCDVGVFSALDSKRILSRAKKLGFSLKLHSDEFEARGGTEIAAELGATSVDHLGAIKASGLKALKKTNGATIATLLPGTCLTLDLKKWPPARKMIESDIPVALATDCNPGSCMTESLPLIMSLACNKLKMTAEEALVGVTLNAAAALNRNKILGSLEKNKFLDFSIWDAERLEEIPYHLNGNLCVGSYVDNSLELYTNS